MLHAHTTSIKIYVYDLVLFNDLVLDDKRKFSNLVAKSLYNTFIPLQLSSSVKSPQSFFPSQIDWWFTQFPFLQMKSQQPFSSSELSPQSSFASHCNCLGMHFLLSQVYLYSGHPNPSNEIKQKCKCYLC